MTAQQTHERNLVWIDERIIALSYAEMEGASQVMKDSLKSLRANRAVLERHGPKEDGTCSCCTGWFNNGTPLPIGITFPCYTYTDITEGLGIPQ